jgi:hypothetical protein
MAVLGMSLTKRSVGPRVLTAVAVLAAGCGGDGGGEGQADAPEGQEEAAAAPAVPWSVAEELTASRSGEYREVVVVTSDESAQPVYEEWVVFDLDAGVLDRTIALHMGTEGDALAAPATRENPSLRFVYTRDTAFMWTAWTESRCGAPWVRMPPEQLAEDTGVDVEADDLLEVEPLDVLRAVVPGEPVTSNDSGSVYAVTVPGGTGLSLSAAVRAGPEAVDRIADLDHDAEVLLARDGAQVDVSIDLSELASELLSSAGQGVTDEVGMSLRWTITAGDGSAAEVPTDTTERTSCVSSPAQPALASSAGRPPVSPLA